MFHLFKKPTSVKTLTEPMDSTLMAAFHGFDGEAIDASLDKIIEQTGKSRSELLATILTDDEVDGCRLDIEGVIKSKPFRIIGDELAEDDVNRLLAIIRPHLSTLALLAVFARFNGYAVAEYVYKQTGDGFLTLDKILPKTDELDAFSFQRTGELVFKHASGRREIVDTQIKCLALTSRATPSRPMGEMMILKAYPAVMLRNKGFAYAGQFIARYAQPYIIGKQGAMGGLGLNNFVKAIFNLSGGGAAAVSGDDAIEITQLAADGGAFLTIERLANSRIQKLLLGRAKVSELSQGSRAASETDDKARQDRMSAYADMLAHAAQHAINAILAANQAFGKPIYAPNGAIFEFIEPKAMDLARAERDKIYMQAGLQFSPDYYKDMLGIEEHHFAEQLLPKALPDKIHHTPASDDGKTRGVLRLSLSQDDPPADKQAPNPSPTHPPLPANVQSVFVLAGSDSYADFSTRLQALSAFDLPDNELINDLAKKSTWAFVSGATANPALPPIPQETATKDQ